MGSIETIERDKGTGFRAVPWNAAERRKGRTRTFFGPDGLDLARAYIRAEEGRLDGIYEDAGAPIVRNSRHTPFAEYAAHWLKVTPGEFHTRSGRRSQVAQIVDAWQGRTIEDLTRTDVRALLSDLETAGASASTRAARLAAVRGIFAEAIEDGLITENPARNVRNPRMVAKRPTRVPTEAEVVKIMANMPGWAAPAVLVAFDCGLRLGEVCGLRWRSTLADQRVLVVGDIIMRNGEERAYTKGKTVLPVPMSDRVAEALELLAKVNPGDPNDRVFRSPRNRAGATSPETLSNTYRRARDRAKLPDPQPRFHDLRHGCGHALAAADAPMTVVQALLRHADITSTRRYMPDVDTAQQSRWLAKARPADRPRLQAVGAERNSA